MGFLDTVKGWLNIGGVKVELQGVNPRVSRAGGDIVGGVTLTSKGDKQVLKMVYRLMLTQTTGSGDARKEDNHILSEVVNKEGFEIKTGETKTLEFAIPNPLNATIKEKGVFGAINALGQLNARVSGAKDTYFVTATCDVKGTALDPSDKIQVTVVD